MSRLDIYVAEQLNISRSLAQNYIKLGMIKINGKTITTKSIKILGNVELINNKPNVNILYEDEKLMIVHKPAAMSVQRIYNTPNYEFVLNEYFPNLAFDGLVNRLDKPVSGIIPIIKDEKLYRELKEKFAHRKIFKKYLAYYNNPLEPQFKFQIFNCPHGKTIYGYVEQCNCDLEGYSMHEMILEGSKNAITYYKKHKDFFECIPLTGRTHQIRLMMDDINHPIKFIEPTKLALFSIAIGF